MISDGIAREFIEIEPMILQRKLANALLQYYTILIHGAAISCNNKCYIFIAPSGTGKTTHIMNWINMI